ncbi:UBC-like protein [Mollisia scopiformis]|uniref:UBC-like protein n=1 Tax=Mollisia scopiformis TaxID=149040 RepID=A0A194WSX8_MOLSC|nr:UBC-like protein [Mollisia scopiformis]KUJ11058.1 UBC-like protein [Mollisia scopiformis]
MSNNSYIVRISKELSDLQKSSDLSLAVACRDIDVRNVKAIIIGPPDTPYEFGFFEFAVKFGKDYPGKAPSVNATTTNGGRCRFNPNIYAGGKVCLSILGTWRGERGEEWSSAQGLESILISIQSLMSSNPYENEPGFETANTDDDKKNQKAYVAKIRHESLRISVIQRLEDYLGISADGAVQQVPSINEEDDIDEEMHEMDRDAFDEASASFDPFRDLCKRRFLWYFDSYLLAISKAKSEAEDEQSFTRMPFECSGNIMEGKFNYTELERRLRLIHKTMKVETARWAEEGLASIKKESSVASNLQRQYEQVVESYKRDKTVTLDVELVDKNPFVWAITYFGRPMTNLDGGLFRIKLFFSPRFPEEQPRAKFETQLFHHRIASDGTPCYTSKRSEDVKSHIDAIIEALEEEEPPYDPRTLVNPEAAKLYWGSADDKKLYNRKLRRAVQRSMEE